MRNFEIGQYHQTHIFPYCQESRNSKQVSPLLEELINKLLFVMATNYFPLIKSTLSTFATLHPLSLVDATFLLPLLVRKS